MSLKNRLAGLSALSLVGFGSMANAALPTAATDAISLVQTDGEALITAYWPVVAAITVGFVIIKLFKRGAGKV